MRHTLANQPQTLAGAFVGLACRKRPLRINRREMVVPDGPTAQSRNALQAAVIFVSKIGETVGVDMACSSGQGLNMIACTHHPAISARAKLISLVSPRLPRGSKCYPAPPLRGTSTRYLFDADGRGPSESTQSSGGLRANSRGWLAGRGVVFVIITILSTRTASKHPGRRAQW